MSNLLKYRSYKETFFLDYLPDEVFINLKKKERIEYRKLRENYQIIESKSSQILTLLEEIRKKQLLVQKLKKQITPSKSKDSYLDKMNLAKENLEDKVLPKTLAQLKKFNARRKFKAGVMVARVAKNLQKLKR